MVEVLAPTTMREGYYFNAKYEGKIFSVVVVSLA
jgi:hypothetical protein